jgi:streptogramin lyase
MLVSACLAAGALSAARAEDPVQATLPAGRGPCCLAVALGSIWLGNHRDGELEQIDPATNRVVWTWKGSLGFDYGDVLAAGGDVWLLQLSIGAVRPPLTRIDPATHALTRVAGLTNPTGFVVAGNAIWVSSFQDPWLRRVDARTARVVDRIRVPGVRNTVVGLAAGGSLWLTSVDHFQPVVERIDPSTGRLVARLRPFASDALVRGIGSAGPALWVAAAASRGPTLVRIDMRTNRITRRLTPALTGNRDAFPALLAPGDGTLWLQTGPGAISRIDPMSGKRLTQLTLPLDPSRPTADYWNSALVAGYGSYWATVYPGQGGLNDPSTGTLLRLAIPAR